LNNKKKFRRNSEDEHTPEADKLASYLQRIDLEFHKLLQTRRWKIGGRVVQFYYLFSGRENIPAAREKKIEKKLKKCRKLIYSGSYAPKAENLADWIEELERNYNIIINTRRWKIGNSIVSFLNAILFRKEQENVTARLAGIFAEYHRWKKITGDEKTPGLGQLAKIVEGYEKRKKEVDAKGDGVDAGNFMEQEKKEKEEETSFQPNWQRLINYFQDLRYMIQPMKILWLLQKPGGGGGAHSVVQEASAMNLLPGVEAAVAVDNKEKEKCLKDYEDIPAGTFYFYDSECELINYGSSFDVVVATYYKTFSILERIYGVPGSAVLAAYYVQDYEPWFIKKNKPELKWEATSTYNALPSALLFAKTDWLCQIVNEFHGVNVCKVFPSLDTNIYHYKYRQKIDQGEKLRISAMVRPQTPRRAPAETMRLLKEIKQEFSDKVDINIFGCNPHDKKYLRLDRDFKFGHLGKLKRREVAALFSVTDIFVDLSSYQAFGRTAFEAMACGCAVIVPRKGGTGEYALHMYNSLLVDTNNPEETKTALKQLVEDDKLRYYLASNAQKITKEYNICKAAWSEVELFWQETARRKVNIVYFAYNGNANAHKQVKENLENLISHTRGPYRLIIIRDENFEQEDLRSVIKYAELKGIRVEQNRAAGGCAHILNELSLENDGDLLVLESRIKVTAYWLEKIFAAASSREKVAAVSPVSVSDEDIYELNFGETANFAGGENMPGNLTGERLARLMEQESPRQRPFNQYGEGKCVYICREALESVGGFKDMDFSFPAPLIKDFCQRAIHKGYAHLIDDATLVVDEEGVDIADGEGGGERLRFQNLFRNGGHAYFTVEDLGNNTLQSLRENMMKRIEDYKKSHPLKGAVKEKKKVIIHVVCPEHEEGKSGNLELLDRMGDYFENYLLFTGWGEWQLYHGGRKHLTLIKEFTFEKTWEVDASLARERLEAIREICEQIKPDLAHIKHFPGNHPEIVRVFKSRGITVVKSFLDYYSLCPAVNILDAHAKCPENLCDSTGQSCCVFSFFSKRVSSNKNSFNSMWKDQVSANLYLCDAFMVDSITNRDLLLRHYPYLAKDKFYIIRKGNGEVASNINFKDEDNSQKEYSMAEDLLDVFHWLIFTTGPLT